MKGRVDYMTNIAFSNAMESNKLHMMSTEAAVELWIDKQYVDDIGVSIVKLTRIINALHTSISTIRTAVFQHYIAEKCKNEISTRRRDVMKTVADGEVERRTRMVSKTTQQTK